MNPRAAGRQLHWWVLRVHWLLGIALLAVYTRTSTAALLFAFAAWAAGIRMDAAGMPRERLSRLGTVIVGALLAVSTADLLFAGRDLLASASFLLVGVQSTKMLLPKGTRDGWQLCAISLLEFLVAASVADEMSFALFAFLFLAASAGAMWSLHDREAEELGRPPGGYVPSRTTAAWAFLAVGAGGFLASAILFAVVPRMEFRRGFQRLSPANALPGFSDEITLREITGIKSDRSVVARVEFPLLEGEPALDGLYLRGAVYSRYAGDGWRSSGTPVSAVPRAGFHHLLREESRGDATVADITLEPANHPRLFAYGNPLRVELGPGLLLADREGNLFLPNEGHPTLRYRLLYTKDPPSRTWNAGGPGLRYLEFPEGFEDIRALGLRIAGDAKTDGERAARLLGFFRAGFRYSLSRPASTLRGFLFDEKSGYCEHYAAGLALLLRAAGVPSRVAAGYLGGEWNGLGRYLIVRQSDAHAWVEAWLDGRWVTLDATPPQGEASPFRRRTGALGLYADWLRQRWDKYVINYSLRMQADAVHAGFSGLRRAPGTVLPPVLPWIPALAAAVALSLLLRKAWRERRRNGTADASRLPTPYERLLRRLEKAGFRPSRGVPMSEMIEAAVRARPELAEEARSFLSLYHRDRFGPAPLPPGLREEAALRANRLRKRLSSV